MKMTTIGRLRLAKVLSLALCLLSSGMAIADSPPRVISLYDGFAPGSEDWSQREVEMSFGDQRIVRNVIRPVLIPHLSPIETNTGIAVVIAPGGGFKFLSIDQEGTFVAQWLNERGINAFVLKYRTERTAESNWGFGLQAAKLFIGAWWRSLGSGQHAFPSEPMSSVQSLSIADGIRAIAILRENADKWHLRKSAIGIMGFSAGGAVAHGTAVQGMGAGRPDFVASIYGVPATKAVPDAALPLFLLHTNDDPIVPPQWSQTLHDEWVGAGLASEIHRYEEGGHGFGMRQQGLPVDTWIEVFYTWLTSQLIAQ